MKRREFGALLASAPFGMTLAAGKARADTTLTVQYAYPDIWQSIFAQLQQEFNKVHPEIHVNFVSNYKDFEDALQGVLRGAITGQLPDVTFQGLNSVRALSDRGLAVDLAQFIKTEPNWKDMGYDDALMRLGQVKDTQYALGWAISTPVIHYNADLVRKAGGDPDNFPKDWDSVLDLALKIRNPAEKIDSFKLDWDTTGNWMWQALVNSYGGTLLSPDEKTVVFDGEAGQKAMNIIGRAVTEAKMPDISQAAAQQDFVLGRLGMWIHSASRDGQIRQSVGNKFAVGSAPFPLSAGDKSRVPAGGVAVVMVETKNPAKQKAAWEYMKFITGPVAQAIIVKATGYLSANDLLAKDPTLIADFVAKNPNYTVEQKQLPYLTGWYAYPGPNSLKIIDVVLDDLQSVVNQSAKPDAVLKKMAADVQALLPT